MLLDLPGTNDPGLKSQLHKEERRGKHNNGQCSPCCPTSCPMAALHLGPSFSLRLWFWRAPPSSSCHARSLCWMEMAIADMYSFDCFSIGRGRGGRRPRAEFVHFLGARLLAFLLIMLTSGGLRYTFIEWDAVLILQMTVLLAIKTQAQDDLKAFEGAASPQRLDMALSFQQR